MKKLSSRLITLVLAICIIGMGLLSATSTILFKNALIEDSLLRINETSGKEATRITKLLMCTPLLRNFLLLMIIPRLICFPG